MNTITWKRSTRGTGIHESICGRFSIVRWANPKGHGQSWFYVWAAPGTQQSKKIGIARTVADAKTIVERYERGQLS